MDNATDTVGYSSAGAGWFAQHIEAKEAGGDQEGLINFLVVKYPNSQSTLPFGANNSRYLAGTYRDSQGKQHGFIAKPTF